MDSGRWDGGSLEGWRSGMKRKRSAGLPVAILTAVSAATVLVLDIGMSQAQSAPNPTISPSYLLREAVEPAGILVHQRRFQRIADANDGNRASGSPGYDASGAYVIQKLRAAGYNVRRQNFEFPFFAETEPTTLARTAPTAKTYTPEDEFAIMTYSGSGTVTARVVPVDVSVPPPATPGSTSGCEASDFSGFPAGAIALIQRGTCSFADKAVNAENAGASAVLVFNEGQEDRTETVAGTLGEPVVDIPVVGTSYAVGEELVVLSRSSVVRARVSAQTESGVEQTFNILADTPTGRADRTVVVGAHLDSVPEGPGINDNGSGTGAILEIALQMKNLNIRPTNRVRFAFWGAEEYGLLGSEYYVNTLPDAQLDDIAMNLNFDMLGSPNYVRFVYDGDGSSTPQRGPAGSAEIEETFRTYFTAKNLPVLPTAFDGRSDYGPFIAAGIPAGGLFSGAEEIKTAQEARVFGGTAGEAYDECYHQACDDITNLSIPALGELSDGAAHATYKYARQQNLFFPNSARTQSVVFTYDEYKGPELIR